MSARFVDVIVDAHADLPDGCAVTFQVRGEPRPVTEVNYRPGIGAAGAFVVTGRGPGGGTVPAQVTPVRVPGSGPLLLVTGGAWGLRLSRAGASPPVGAIAEPYLLLGDADIVR